MIEPEPERGVELDPDDYELTVVKYNRRPDQKASLADKALERVGDDDTWNRTAKCRMWIMSRRRRLWALLLAMLPSSLRTKLEPKPLSSDW